MYIDKDVAKEELIDSAVCKITIFFPLSNLIGHDRFHGLFIPFYECPSELAHKGNKFIINNTLKHSNVD